MVGDAINWLQVLDLLSASHLILVASRNLLLYQSLPTTIRYRQAKVRRRKDGTGVGAAARGLVERLYRVPRRLHSDGRLPERVRRALSTRSGDRGRPT